MAFFSSDTTGQTLVTLHWKSPFFALLHTSRINPDPANAKLNIMSVWYLVKKTRVEFKRHNIQMSEQPHNLIVLLLSSSFLRVPVVGFLTIFEMSTIRSTNWLNCKLFQGLLIFNGVTLVLDFSKKIQIHKLWFTLQLMHYQKLNFDNSYPKTIRTWNKETKSGPGQSDSPWTAGYFSISWHFWPRGSSSGKRNYFDEAGGGDPSFKNRPILF